MMNKLFIPILVDGQGIQRVTIFNVNGQEYKTQSLFRSATNTFDLGNLPKGVYYLKVVTAKDSFINKIILE